MTHEYYENMRIRGAQYANNFLITVNRDPQGMYPYQDNASMKTVLNALTRDEARAFVEGYKSIVSKILDNLEADSEAISERFSQGNG